MGNIKITKEVLPNSSATMQMLKDLKKEEEEWCACEGSKVVCLCGRCQKCGRRVNQDNQKN